MPNRETATDLENERKIARVLEERWRVKLQKIPQSSRCVYFADFAVLSHNRNLQGFVEVRCRRDTVRNQFPPVMALSKWLWALQVVRAGCGFWFVFRFADGEIAGLKVLIEMEGRLPIQWFERSAAKNGDRYAEACVLLPSDEFKILGKVQVP